MDAVAEAVQAEIKSYMAPAVTELAEGAEIAGLKQRLGALEGTFGVISTTMQGVGDLISAMETAGVIEDKETSKAATQLAGSIDILAQIGVTAVKRGHEVLDEVDAGDGPPNWDVVVDRITEAMLEDATATAKAQMDDFARDLTRTVVGTGTYQLPRAVQEAIVLQLRPVRMVMVPMVSAGRALNTVLLALLWSTALLLVLTAGRTRRIALWTGGVTVVVGATGSATARALEAMALALAEGLGAMGQAVAEAGKFISRMLSWGWSVLRMVLDLEPLDIGDALEGWTTQDVLESATYGVFTHDVTDRLSVWSGSLLWMSVLALSLWAILFVAEWAARRRPAAAPGSLMAVLQQPGGMRMEDPLLVLIPRRGESVQGALPHASTSRLLARGVFVDMSWLLVAYLTLFAIIGMSTFLMLGPSGAGGIVTSLSAVSTGCLVVLGLATVRLIQPGGRTVCGALSGEELVNETGHTEPWRLRSLRAQSAWMGAIFVATVLVCFIHSATLGVGLMLALLLLAELSVIVLSDGTQTLGAKLMGLKIRSGTYGITPEHRISMIRLLTNGGTVWSLTWGLCTVWFFGMGLYALFAGIITLVFWILGRNGADRKLMVRLCAYIRTGSWLSLDVIGMGLGIATLWLLRDDTARAHFASSPPKDAPQVESETLAIEAVEAVEVVEE